HCSISDHRWIKYKPEFVSGGSVRHERAREDNNDNVEEEEEIFDGWVDESPQKHDEHDEPHDEHDEHDEGGVTSEERRRRRNNFVFIFSHNPELWLKMNMTVFEIAISWKHESYEKSVHAIIIVEIRKLPDETSIMFSRTKITEVVLSLRILDLDFRGLSWLPLKPPNYPKADITNEDDFKIRGDLDLADEASDENPEESLRMFTALLTKYPVSPRSRHGKAQALDRLAEKKRSNTLLQDAVDSYENVIALGNVVPDKLFLQSADRCINRQRFKGLHHRAIHIHKKLMLRFPDEPEHANQLAVTYLMINRMKEAKQVLETTLMRWPNNGFAQVHYGFILKTNDNNYTAAVNYLSQGISSREPGTVDGRFFFQLGDALTRLGRHEEAVEIYERGVKEGLFLSKYQRSLYNVNRLQAQPWWTPNETTYRENFQKLQDNWQQIRAEGLAVLAGKVFKDEAENLKQVGNWKQFELYARGRKITSNCMKAPFTCKLISEFPAARDCRRGQVKFSVMQAGTHVWPHCGPTNCRLRSHLGLVVPQGTYIRVAEETRSWEEGKLFIFDDSFEHEVWHNGTSVRLVLIVDVWHPELTLEERRTLPAI
ncbi:hypothetical protein L9F63_016376, partial [Diploptera punctata]